MSKTAENVIPDSAARSSVSNWITSIVLLVIGLISGVIVNRSLGPEGKGVFTNLQLVLSLYVPMLTFGYEGGVLYYGLRKTISIDRYFVPSLALFGLLSVLIIPLVYLLVRGGLLGSIIRDVPLKEILIIVAVVPVFLWNMFLEKMYYVHGLFRVLNKRLILVQSIMLILYLGVYLFAELNVFRALLVFATAQVSSLILNLYFLLGRKIIKPRIASVSFKLPWIYGLKSWLSVLITKANDKFDVVLLTFWLSSASLGIYGVGVTLCNLIATVPTSMLTVLYNRMVGKESTEAQNLLVTIHRLAFWFTVLSGIVLIVFAKWVIVFLYGIDFAPSFGVVVFYIPGVVFNVEARLIVKYFASIGKPLRNSLIYIAGFLVGTPFYIILIPRFGVEGAAIASSISYLAAFVFSYQLFYKESKVRLRDFFLLEQSDLKFIKHQFIALRNR